MNRSKYFVLFFTLIFLSSCATYNAQYKTEQNKFQFPENKEIAHSFYLLGDAGNSSLDEISPAIQGFKEELQKAPKNSTAIFLGDNIYESGMPEKNHPERKLAEHRLNVQINSVKDFKGRTIFIPGNHDWYSGIKGLKRQEKYIEKALGKNTFLPENGCPIKKVNVSDDIVLLILDSQWYITNWDKHPTINDECEFKTRTLFFDEVESQIKKARGKTTIIAVHNPVFTNGNHGGQYSFKSHMQPLPVLGSLKNLIRKTGGVANVDDQSKLYLEFKKRLVTLSQENDKVVFVSGHDHNLQYNIQDNLPQIVSGSGSKLTPTRLAQGGVFTYTTPGYARLDVFQDGSSYVRFYSVTDNKIVFQTTVHKADNLKLQKEFESIPLKKSASIYTDEETQKGGLYTWLWGERYRKYFSTKIMAPTVDLDTLFGGLKPVRKGGGHQSKSLRLVDNDDREYVMRALRKNAVQYMQAVAFKDQYIEGQFDDTYAEGLLLDVFTGSHPYAPFVVGTMAKAVGIFHTNPVLYYIPKQKSLSYFNSDFGDELYMIEERAADNHGDKASFGFSNELISTYDLLEELRKDEDNIVDEEAYIRARLFDMLIGDWDRHEDQWRWAKFKEGKKTVYRPMPRDRDQAFSIMADGLLMKLGTTLVPALRLMQSFDEELKSPKWFNLEPYPLDIALISESGINIWDNQVKFIRDNLSDEVIDEAFQFMPEEVSDQTIDDIKRKLKGRRFNLQRISDEYFKVINKITVIKGTDKDDWFDVERKKNTTLVTAFRIKNGKKGERFYQREFSRSETKEIWIYGLDDDDTYNVFGSGDQKIKIRLIGGQNNDSYTGTIGKKVKVYDFKSKKNSIENNRLSVKLTDDYETNIYDHKKLKFNSNQIIPTFGANPDDGFKIGIADTYTVYGFERNPFTSQHILSAQYYFATNGYDLNYKGEFANIFGSWNLGFDVSFTSPNYSVNFFGFGNETVNPNAEDEDNFDLDYNRVKLQTFKVSPSLIWQGDIGSKVRIGLNYETIEVEETQDRFINTFFDLTEEDNQNSFASLEAQYSFINKNDRAYPTLGFEFDLLGGLTVNFDEETSFAYVIPSMAFDHRLSANDQLVLATKLRGHLIFGDDFEFYQAANIGAENGLRGYRFQRFTGKNSFVHSTDLRLNFRKRKTGILPINIGLYGGFDYGRVWLEDEDSDTWHNSIGGGIFIIGAEMITANVSAFNSDDGLRFAFRLGFGF